MEKYLRVREVARKFNLTEATIRSYVLNKKIPYYKIGSVLRFNESELDEWVKNDCPRGVMKNMALNEFKDAMNGTEQATDRGVEA
jgi:excisionase family DNA binding protein